MPLVFQLRLSSWAMAAAMPSASSRAVERERFMMKNSYWPLPPKALTVTVRMPASLRLAALAVKETATSATVSARIR